MGEARAEGSVRQDGVPDAPKAASTGSRVVMIRVDICGDFIGRDESLSHRRKLRDNRQHVRNWTVTP